MTNTPLYTETRAALEAGVRSNKGKLKFDFTFESDMAGSCIMSRPVTGWKTEGAFSLATTEKPETLFLDLKTPGFNWGSGPVALQGIGVDLDKFQALISRVEDRVIG